MFWKLAPPNLNPGRVHLPTDSMKAVCEQRVSQTSDLIDQFNWIYRPAGRFEQAKSAGPMGTISPHEPVIKIEIGTGK